MVGVGGARFITFKVKEMSAIQQKSMASEAKITFIYAQKWNLPENWAERSMKTLTVEVE